MILMAMDEEVKRLYMRQYMYEYRRRKGLLKRRAEPDSSKPSKELRQKDYHAYMAQYMRWWRANGPVREDLDPEGRLWST